ncbi:MULTISPECIES: ABC transporter permease [Streptomyces]|uniref:ABC transporter permease n=1 Tax=Streptomyces cyaneofuscatus TaxID=66883 RepID=A0ABZ1F0Y4_9ACTN|nr:ABC transporter permease [Streptomyces cyaneofuscatus]WSB10007.1 ABC transporter permease [Streptomyces cyaneofuscatus]WSD46460.1 ABC transporter permease [Streptomyces cyaneofuscatus]WTA89837.1 ABC transporter permease [Streptomyces cyaneofuscatus]
MAFLVLIALAAAVPGLLADGSPTASDISQTLRPPGADHPLGTDANGRDVYTRIVHGARPSLLTGIGATALALVCGTLLGLLAALGGRVADEAVMRLADTVLALPSLLLALLILGVTGPGTVGTLYAIAVYSIPLYARLVRVQTLAIRHSGYIEAARSLGLREPVIVLRHILPNAFGPLLVLATIEVGTAIVAVSSLSYLGFGPQPPAPEWGAMLGGGRDYFGIAWWVAVFPGLAITATVLSTVVTGRWLQRRLEGRPT